MLIDRWQEVEALFHAACERPTEERRAYLESATDDEELRREVESLLANDDQAALFLESNEEEAATEARLPVGERIGPYVVVEFMKAGGMGEVYKARDTRLDRTVALKFLPHVFAANRAALERFQREARAASALNHPRICTIHDMGQHQNRPYFVMELLVGQSLKERIAVGPVSIAEIVDFALQICDALQAAHAMGIVHRDIKPANSAPTRREEGFGRTYYGHEPVLDRPAVRVRRIPGGHHCRLPSSAPVHVQTPRDHARIGVRALDSVPTQERGVTHHSGWRLQDYPGHAVRPIVP